MEVDAPKAQDLGKVLAEIRAQYDALAQKNLEELEKQWGQQVRAPPGHGGGGGCTMGSPQWSPSSTGAGPVLGTFPPGTSSPMGGAHAMLGGEPH